MTPPARALTLTVRQTQVDTATADSTGLRYATPLAFRAPIAIRVGTAAGDIVRRVTIDRREQAVRIDSLPGAPDHGGLRRRERGGEDAGVRAAHAVAGHAAGAAPASLAARLGHPAARRGGPRIRPPAAALAAAARGADYFLTRAQAADALAGFPGGRGAAGARGGGARHLRAGAGGGGRVARPGGRRRRARHRARRRGAADSSYQVRAAALVALARLGAPDARAAILDGLGTPSYRDAIQNAAITLAVQRPDPELVAALGRVIGSQSLPATALAALTSRGDTVARGLLRSALDDERPWVREWTLEAVEQQLDPGPALALLREAQPSLTRAEARSAVAQAIGRLERPPS